MMMMTMQCTSVMDVTGFLSHASLCDNSVDMCHMLVDCVGG